MIWPTSTGPQRLFGVPHSETLFGDLAECYESQIEDYADEHDRRPRVIEEWTVHPPEYHLPSADRIVDWLVEQTGEDGEVDEGFFEHMENMAQRADVLVAAEALRSALAAQITYRMADKRVAEHAITWDEAGEPLVNGKPMYVLAEPSSKGSTHA